jgi:ubiquitin-protein ligase
MQSGIGYGGAESHAMHFYHLLRSVKNSPRPSIDWQKTQNVVTPVERQMGQLFRRLNSLMPKFEACLTFDANPPQNLLLSFLHRSPVMARVAQLLRNDSIDELFRLRNVYEALLDFVQTMSEHPSTSSAVYTRRPEYPATGSLQSVSLYFGRMDPIFSVRTVDKAKVDTLPTLAKLLRPLETNAQQVLRHANANRKDFNTEDDQFMMSLCHKICAVGQFHRINCHDTAPTSDASMTKVLSMSNWHKEHAVADLPDSIILQTFYFVKEAMGIADSKVAPGRMKRIISELATLSSSLPEGIYLRHGDSRLDIMKVLITGPKATPYANGLFEFDLMCPADYPTSPPMLHFKTTNGGRIRFNPNLYEDGKGKVAPQRLLGAEGSSNAGIALTLLTVCLSLLGTWHGEPWRPGTSTILQILVSVQSMIFCDEPWYNEPGREWLPNDPSSRSYNLVIRRLTLSYALLPWAATLIKTQAVHDNQNSANKDKGKDKCNIIAASDEVWKDVISRHFHGDNGQLIMGTVEGWVKESDAQTEIGSIVKQLRNILLQTLSEGN